MQKFTLLALLSETKASTNVFSLKKQILEQIKKIPQELLDSKYYPNKKYDTNKARDEINNSESGDLFSSSNSYDDNLVNTRFEDELFKTLRKNISYAIYLWLHSQENLQHPTFIRITSHEKKNNGAIAALRYDDNQKIPQSKIPVEKFHISGRFITILFHEIIDELRTRPKPNKSTKSEIYITRVTDSINSALSKPTIISELNSFCAIIAHEAQHLAQHKSGANDNHYPNFDKNMLGNKRNADGEPHTLLDYFAEYTEIDAYAVEVVSNLLLTHVEHGSPANVPKLIQMAKHYFYTEFNDEDLGGYTTAQLQLIKRRFMKKVVNGLNEYNDKLPRTKSKIIK